RRSSDLSLACSSFVSVVVSSAITHSLSGCASRSGPAAFRLCPPALDPAGARFCAAAVPRGVAPARLPSFPPPPGLAPTGAPAPPRTSRARPFQRRRQHVALRRRPVVCLPTAGSPAPAPNGAVRLRQHHAIRRSVHHLDRRPHYLPDRAHEQRRQRRIRDRLFE